jgi:hypothetical protein
VDTNNIVQHEKGLGALAPRLSFTPSSVTSTEKRWDDPDNAKPERWNLWLPRGVKRRIDAQVRGYPGIELRGAGGYQLVPSSHVAATDRDPAGDYRLADGWTLERLMVDLADLPAWAIELWRAVDADGPATTGQAREATADADLPAALTTSTRTPPSPRSQRRAPRPTKQGLLTTGASSGARARTTGLNAEHGRKYRGTFAYGCALHLVRLLGQPGVWLEDKHTFACLLPGHREATPSARWVWQRDGSVLYHDLHVRTENKVYWAVPEVYAAFITGKLVSFSKHKPSMKTWSIRLAVEAGLTEPYPLPKPAISADATPLDRTFCQGVWLLFACKWTYEVEKPTMLGRDFVAGWCGIPEGSVWRSMRWALSRHLLMQAGYQKRCPVYLPGEEWTQ